MHDDHTIAILKQLFDGIIETKEENDKNYIRTVGLSSTPTPWLEYEFDIKIDGGKAHSGKADDDSLRDTHLRSDGWNIRRFSASRAGNDLDSVINEILRLC